MNKFDCLSEKLSTRLIGLLILPIALLIGAIGALIVPVVGLVFAIPVAVLGLGFVFAPESKVCRLLLDKKA